MVFPAEPADFAAQNRSVHTAVLLVIEATHSGFQASALSSPLSWIKRHDAPVASRRLQRNSASNTPETYEPWRTDGNTVELAADINPGTNSSFPQSLQIYQDQLFFSAVLGEGTDRELWKLLTAPLRIESLQRSGENMQIFWNTLGGTTNIVQASETVAGPYTNISEAISVSGSDQTITNYTDPATATAPTRFYRVVAP